MKVVAVRRQTPGITDERLEIVDLQRPRRSRDREYQVVGRKAETGKRISQRGGSNDRVPIRFQQHNQRLSYVRAR